MPVRTIQLRLYDDRPGRGEVVRLDPPPATRAGCAEVERPCTRACRHNTGVTMADERPGRRWTTGAGRKGPRVAPTWTPELAGCALDLVDGNPDGLLLDEVGAALGVTGEAVRQAEERALRKLRRAGLDADHLELLMGGRK